MKKHGKVAIVGGGVAGASAALVLGAMCDRKRFFGSLDDIDEWVLSWYVKKLCAVRGYPEALASPIVDVLPV